MRRIVEVAAIPVQRHQPREAAVGAHQLRVRPQPDRLADGVVPFGEEHDFVLVDCPLNRIRVVRNTVPYGAVRRILDVDRRGRFPTGKRLVP